MRTKLFFSTFALVILIASNLPYVCAATPPTSTPNSDFPSLIPFESGLTEFQPGDQITITEVRGTSPDMQSGICKITGTYTLNSQPTATLAASVTARFAKDGTGPWNAAQTITLQKGHGTFTLLLPISIQGYPHISFYSKTNSFGGIYLGTGDSVLHHW